MATFTVNEFVVKLENAKRELERARVVNAATVSVDALALVKRRIQQERVDSNGQELGTYSQRKVPFWYFRNQRTLGNSANKVRELYKRYGYFASYADWKAVNNQTDPRINLTFTGRMMNGLKVVLAPSRRDVVAVF